MAIVSRRLLLVNIVSVLKLVDGGLRMTGLVDDFGAEVDKIRGEVRLLLTLWLVLKAPSNTLSNSSDKLGPPREFKDNI